MLTVAGRQSPLASALCPRRFETSAIAFPLPPSLPPPASRSLFVSVH